MPISKAAGSTTAAAAAAATATAAAATTTATAAMLNILRSFLLSMTFLHARWQEP